MNYLVLDWFLKNLPNRVALRCVALRSVCPVMFNCAGTDIIQYNNRAPTVNLSRFSHSNLYFFLLPAPISLSVSNITKNSDYCYRTQTLFTSSTTPTNLYHPTRNLNYFIHHEGDASTTLHPSRCVCIHAAPSATQPVLCHRTGRPTKIPGRIFELPITVQK
jgi:hypothetical protein